MADEENQNTAKQQEEEKKGAPAQPAVELVEMSETGTATGETNLEQAKEEAKKASEKLDQKAAEPAAEPKLSFKEKIQALKQKILEHPKLKQFLENPKIKKLTDLLPKKIDLKSFLKSDKKSFSSVFTQFKETVLSIKTKDGETRKMVIVFYLSLVGMVGVLAFQGKMMKEKYFPAPPPAVSEEPSYEEKRRMEALKEKPYAYLGTFMLQVIYKNEASRRAIAEFTLECDKKNACDFLNENLEMARDWVIRAINPATEDEILTIEGKNRLKQKILDAVNRQLKNGQLLQVYFSELKMI